MTHNPEEFREALRRALEKRDIYIEDSKGYGRLRLVHKQDQVDGKRKPPVEKPGEFC